MLAGLLYGGLWLALGVILMSTLLYAATRGEESMPAWSLGNHGVSSLCGGFTSGKRSGKKAGIMEGCWEWYTVFSCS